MLLKYVFEAAGIISKVRFFTPALSLINFLIAAIRAAAYSSVFFEVAIFEITISLYPCVLIKEITL